MTTFNSRMPPPNPNLTCPSCGEEIDPEVCWCGDAIDHGSMASGHSPIPMGCTCGYISEFDDELGMVPAPGP